MANGHPDISRRKSVEAALGQSEEFALATLDALAANICVLDGDGRILAVNQSWLAFAHANGLPAPAATLGANYLTVCDAATGEDAEEGRKFAAGIRAVLIGATEAFAMEYSCHSPAERRWFLGRVTRFPAGGPVRVVVSHDNITQRRQTEEELRRYRQVFDSVNDAIFLRHILPSGEPGRFLDVNAVACRRLGYSREELLQKSPLDIDPNISLEGIRSHTAKVLAGEGALFETVHVARDGRRIPVEISYQLFHVDGQPTVLSTARDLTQRKAAEEALRKSEENYRNIVANAPIGIFQSTATRLLSANPILASMFGYDSPADALANSHDPASYFADPAQRREIVHEALSSHSPVQREVQYRRKDGSTFTASLTLRAVRDAAGEVILLEGFVKDITDQRRAEEQFRQAQKMEAVGQLAGGVAHDFNNVLAAIMMNLGLLRDNPALDDESRQSLDELVKESQRAADMTRQLLMFGRRSVLDIKTLDLNELVANLLKMLGRLIGEDISIRFDRNEGVPPVDADPGMLEQVLMNLCVNARDAMPEGGRITITTAVLELDDQAAKARPNSRPGRFVTLWVADTGCGMDAVTQARIFEPFFTTKEPGKGTGLGLATVHGIIAQHQGWVEVESQPGQGTLFRVFLPASSASPARPGQARETAAMGGDETVLLVEDDASVRRGLARGLRMLGYAVLDAADGPQALALWRQHSARIALLLTDMVMPGGMNGLDLAGKLRADQPGLKVVISSGYNAELVGLGSRRAKGIRYLPKPYPISALWRAIRECLDEAAEGPSSPA
jgi:PAS domain S-box-containing protein